MALRFRCFFLFGLWLQNINTTIILCTVTYIARSVHSMTCAEILQCHSCIPLLVNVVSLSIDCASSLLCREYGQWLLCKLHLWKTLQYCVCVCVCECGGSYSGSLHLLFPVEHSIRSHDCHVLVT